MKSPPVFRLHFDGIVTDSALPSIYLTFNIMNRRNETTVATGVAGFSGGEHSGECLQGTRHIHSQPHENALMRPRTVLRLLGLGPLLPFEAGIFSARGYFRVFLRIPA